MKADYSYQKYDPKQRYVYFSGAKYNNFFAKRPSTRYTCDSYPHLQKIHHYLMALLRLVMWLRGVLDAALYYRLTSLD